ncbi:MAG: hypothetical protein GC162_20250 [Planctomycetes bacterium]|nr:hypothetical protein [Planctomycetota bacterium]
MIHIRNESTPKGRRSSPSRFVQSFAELSVVCGAFVASRGGSPTGFICLGLLFALIAAPQATGKAVMMLVGLLTDSVDKQPSQTTQARPPDKDSESDNLKDQT